MTWWRDEWLTTLSLSNDAKRAGHWEADRAGDYSKPKIAQLANRPWAANF